ncbi:TM2 domain-containing protein [Oceanirhabdus sp. W0125-5]|uniref:TM2 domain-containing protein n=1 Tax=Oceanirhabdus sp. W0125-5 TaxID=2999116 RepID=UPI0022F2B735|nr:TM2 domain-containing protein [Oceanirhabdus sp. W0125-5]WBW99141.1 TM2 domain-containing protein [Oceanirhabdus sp. W0125-5]
MKSLPGGERNSLRCYIHNNRDAVGTCVGCGNFICTDCRVTINGKNYCEICVQELVNSKDKRIENLSNNNSNGTTVYMNNSSSNLGYYGERLVPVKSKAAAGVLAIFFGAVGVHKFYLGKPLQGTLSLLFCWTGIPAVLGVVEGISYIASSDEKFAHKYGGRYLR